MACSSKSQKKHWRMAKKAATEQGQEGNYPYVQGIFQTMEGKKSKVKKAKVEKSVFTFDFDVQKHNGEKLQKLLDRLHKSKNEEEIFELKSLIGKIK